MRTSSPNAIVIEDRAGTGEGCDRQAHYPNTLTSGASRTGAGGLRAPHRSRRHDKEGSR